MLKFPLSKNKTNNHTKTFCQFELSFHLWKKFLEKLLYTFSPYKLVTMWIFSWSTPVPQHTRCTETTRGLVKSPFRSSSCWPSPQHTALRLSIIPSYIGFSLFKTLRTLYSPNLLPLPAFIRFLFLTSSSLCYPPPRVSLFITISVSFQVNPRSPSLALTSLLNFRLNSPLEHFYGLFH